MLDSGALTVDNGKVIKMNPPEGNRSIHDYSRLALLLCVIGWVLPGCERPSPAPADTRAAADLAKPGNDPEAPASKAATLAEVRQAIIDWFKFPKPEGAVWERTDLRDTHYSVPGTVAQAADYYRKTMAGQGWIEDKKAIVSREPDKYQSLEFNKAGFLVNLSLTGKKQSVEVLLSNRGNVDPRRLPKPAGAKVAVATRSNVFYTTTSTPESVAEFCRKELASLGWRDTPVARAKAQAKEETTALRFVQNAMECGVTITRNKEGGADVSYFTPIRSQFESADVAANFASKDISKPATSGEGLETLDLRKLPRVGESDFLINNGVRAQYEARTSVAKAVAFYRKTLAEQGWALVLPLVDENETASLRFEKAGYFLSLEIEDLINEENKAGLVRISLTNHGNVDLRQLPYLPGAEIGYDRKVHIQYRASATAEEAAAFYRQELSKLGWKENKNLEFFQNDVRLKIYVDKTREGETPIQVHTDLRDER